MLALFMIGVTVLYVVGYSSGVLPFMSQQYLALRKEGGLMPTTQPPVVQDEDVKVVQTAATFANALDLYSGQGLDVGLYSDDGQHLVRYSLSGLGSISGNSLSMRMGFVCKTDENGGVSYYAPADGLKDVTGLLADVSWTNNRDANGSVLFYGSDGYLKYANGTLSGADYDAYNCDKGIDYYPSYMAGYDTAYKVFKAEGESLFGLKTVDGKIVLQPKYKDVYGVSEGRVVAVGTDGKLYIYTADGDRISVGEYFDVPEGESAVGCYFYSMGLVRVYTEAGNSVMIDKNGRVLDIPYGFEVCGYSDGVILLKQVYTNSDNKKVAAFGYMTADGSWISMPDYTAARPFYEGLAAVKGTNGLWGMIDLEGNVVVPTVFDGISDCQDGAFTAYAQKYGNYVFGKVSG